MTHAIGPRLYSRTVTLADVTRAGVLGAGPRSRSMAGSAPCVPMRLARHHLIMAEMDTRSAIELSLQDQERGTVPRSAAGEMPITALLPSSS